MVTPERRRIAVAVLVDRFGVSERRACRVVGQYRSTQRRERHPRREADLKLRAGCGRSPGSIPAGGGRPPIRSCAGKAGRSTASGSSDCGERKA